MAEIVLFHSVLGVRQGITDAAKRLRSAGHIVHVPNLYEYGVVFDDFKEGDAYVQSIGNYPELLKRTRDAVENISHNVVYAGFSNGGASAEYLAATRPGAQGALLFSGALPLEMLLQIGGDEQRQWPSDVPVQLHYTREDPFRNNEWIKVFIDNVQSRNVSFEFYEYPGNGHLFTDKSLVKQYDPEAASNLWHHVDDCLAKISS